jgi:MFS family permease
VDDYSAYSGLSHPFGLATGDLALLAGGIALVIGILFLGLAGNRRGRRRWLGALGWATLILSVGALGFGTVRSTASASTGQPA